MDNSSGKRTAVILAIVVVLIIVYVGYSQWSSTKSGFKTKKKVPNYSGAYSQHHVRKPIAR